MMELSQELEEAYRNIGSICTSGSSNNVDTGVSVGDRSCWPAGVWEHLVSELGYQSAPGNFYLDRSCSQTLTTCSCKDWIFCVIWDNCQITSSTPECPYPRQNRHAQATIRL